MRGAGGRPIQVVGRTFGAGGGPGGFGLARSGPARPGPVSAALWCRGSSAGWWCEWGVLGWEGGGDIMGGAHGLGCHPPPLPAGW